MSNLKVYSVMTVSVDGSLQVECQKIDVRNSGRKIRAYMRSAIPIAGIELDLRDYVGGERRFAIRVLEHMSGTLLHDLPDLRCIHFAVGQDMRKSACARYIFESTREATVDPFGYSLTDAR